MLVELVVELKPLVLDHRVLRQLLDLLEKSSHGIILTNVAHDGVILGQVGTTSIEDILEEDHHLLDIFLATLVVFEGLELLFGESDLIGAQGLHSLSKDSTCLIEREGAAEVSFLDI